jgi:hypothetical protein
MKSPYMNTFEIAEHLRFIDPQTHALNVRAALEWINRHIPPAQVRKRGRALLVHRDDVEAALRPRVLDQVGRS